MQKTLAQSWLLLVHQLPAQPAYLRVKVWRRLQALGAVAVKNAVYALPGGERAREDFGWLLREIASGGGEAFVCEARLVDGLADRQVRPLFDRGRDADYEELARQARGPARAPAGVSTSTASPRRGSSAASSTPRPVSGSCRRRATRPSPASCASTCSGASSPTRATAAPSRSCWRGPGRTTRRCARSPSWSTTSTSRTAGSPGPRRQGSAPWSRACAPRPATTTSGSPAGRRCST